MSTQRRPSATIAKVLDTATVSDEVLLAKRTKLQKEYDAILHQLEDLGYHQYTIVIDQFQKLAEIEAASAMSISLCN